jgi:transcriptional regulator with XRE-family HTH domain
MTARSRDGMDFQTAFGEVVREQRHANGLTLRSLSGRGFIALGYLSEVERGHKCPSSDIIASIADGLGIDAGELIVQTGIRMTGVPESPESLFKLRDRAWDEQYSDLR